MRPKGMNVSITRTKHLGHPNRFFKKSLFEMGQSNLVGGRVQSICLRVSIGSL